MTKKIVPGTRRSTPAKPAKASAPIGKAPKGKGAVMRDLETKLLKSAAKGGPAVVAVAGKALADAKAKAKASKAPAKPAAEAAPTGYQIAGGEIAYGTAVRVNWPTLGDFDGIVIARDDGRVMDRPIPRVKANLARVYYEAEGTWADHSADQIVRIEAKASKKTSKATPAVKPGARRKAA